MKHVVDLRKKKQKASAPSSGQRQLPLPAPSTRRKREPLRVRRRRVQMWGAAGGVFAMLLLVAGVIYTSYLPQFNVQAIDVSGASQVSAVAVSSYASSVIKSNHHVLLSPSNIFLYNPAAIGSALKAQFPAIQSAEVSREGLLSTTVHVALTERAPYAKWCASVQRDSSASTSEALTDLSTTSTTQVDNSNTLSDTCYVLDKAGVIFVPANSYSALAKPYIFSGGLTAATGTSDVIGSTFARGHFSGVLELLDLLARQDFAPQGATVVSDTDFTVPLASGFSIKVSFGESADAVASNLQLVLNSDALKDKQSQLEYVDFRFGDRVYYKLKGADSL